VKPELRQRWVDALFFQRTDLSLYTTIPISHATYTHFRVNFRKSRDEREPGQTTRLGYCIIPNFFENAVVEMLTVLWI